MKDNFYRNPLRIIWTARSNLLPIYLVVAWLCIVVLLAVGTLVFDFINFSIFSISNYFTASLTGLTFTLAIFTAERNVFKTEELAVLANHKEPGDKFEGRALLELLGPFVFTSLIFLITGTLALLVPYINFKCTETWSIIFTQIYLDLLVLGLFSLFNLVITMLNDVYHSVKREHEYKK